MLREEYLSIEIARRIAELEKENEFLKKLVEKYEKKLLEKEMRKRNEVLN